MSMFPPEPTEAERILERHLETMAAPTNPLAALLKAAQRKRAEHTDCAIAAKIPENRERAFARVAALEDLCEVLREAMKEKA